MFARFSKGTAHALGLTLTRARSPHHSHDLVSVIENSEEMIIDLDVLLLPVHDFLVPWWRYAGECRKTLVPVCSSLQSLLSDDVEQIVQLFLSLESSDEDTEYDYNGEIADVVSPCSINIGPKSILQASYCERPPQKQHSQPTTPIVIPGSHISKPTIIITPCETQPRETFALVPVQDSAFGSRLTVPFHPKLNHTFPPMAYAGPSIHMLPDIDWKWRDGHWQRVLPGIDEQMLKGMFSRAICRRKVPRRFTCTLPPASGISRKTALTG